MPSRFAHDGISFQYPESWLVEREDNEAGWTVSLHSPGTAFMMLTVREDMPTTDELADTALEALREDYPDLEAVEAIGSLRGQPTIGHDMRFFSLDLTNVCWTRCFYAPAGTVLVLCQATDLDNAEVVLRAICASLLVDEE